VLEVDLTVVERWAVLSAHARQTGHPLRALDGLIAATDSVHDLTLATRNVVGFRGTGVDVFDPWSP